MPFAPTVNLFLYNVIKYHKSNCCEDHIVGNQQIEPGQDVSHGGICQIAAAGLDRSDQDRHNYREEQDGQQHVTGAGLHSHAGKQCPDGGVADRTQQDDQSTAPVGTG